VFGQKIQRKFQHLEDQLEKLQAALKEIASVRQPDGVDISKFLSVISEGQASSIASTGAFIKMIHEISLERMGAALGKRGGLKRAALAKRDARGRMLPVRAPSNCLLCDNPLAADFSLRQWEEHQSHKGNGNGGRAIRPDNRDYEPKFERTENGDIREHQPEQHVHPDGTVHSGPPHPTYPLPSIPDPNAPSGASGVTSEGNPATTGNGHVES